MPPIKDASMGDVWPAAQPGSDPGDYGSAWIDPPGPFPIRSFQTLTITYTAGKFGLDDTGAIRIAYRFVHDGGPLQTSDPAAPNYVTAQASNGVSLRLCAEPYAYRPWYFPIRVEVTGGFMHPGDTITIVVGDTSGGSPGFLLQTIAEAAFEFRLSVDACATGQFQPVADRLQFAIIHGPPAICHVAAPGLRRPGEPFALGLRFEDDWGNPSLPDDPTLHLSADAPIDGLPTTVTLPEGSVAMRIDGLSVAAASTVRVTAADASGTPLATSNPIVVAEGPLAGYWGDLHGQSGETVGLGSIREYLDFAKDIAFLDVTGHQANDFQITKAFWREINEITTEMDMCGTFVVYPGYEWSGNTPVGGDHNVFFRHAGCQIRRSSHAMLTDRSDIDTDATTLDALFEALAPEDCVLWAHIGGRPADVAYAHDPALRTAVEVHSNWGTFEWVLTDSLALGHRIGVVSNSDGHKGRPGAGSPGATEFGSYGGLTCFLAPELTRDAIFEAMRRRHHYATSGSRMHVDLRARFATPAQLYTRDPRHTDTTPETVHEAMMGDLVATSGASAGLSIRLATVSPVERVDIMNGADLVETLRPYRADDLGRRFRITWHGAEYRGRGRNTFWEGEIALTGTALTAMTPINRWNLDRRLEQVGRDRILFDAVTSGNFGGVDVTLDRIEEATLAITTNRVSGKVELGDMSVDDVIFDAGGLDRHIRIRRLPDEMSAFGFEVDVPIAIVPDRDNPIWLRVATLDGHLAWTSPIYLWND